MERQRLSFLARTTMTLLLAMLTTVGAWADVDLSTYVVINEKPTVTAGVTSNWASTENYGMLVDGKLKTKYGLNSGDPYVEFNFATPITPKGYALWTANDTEGQRNPKAWTILAKNEGETSWTTLATVDNSNGDKLPMANETETRFALSNTNAYQYFRFEATRNSTGEFQLAELQFLTTDNDLAATVVSGIDKYYTYTGSAISITPVVKKQDNTTLTLGTHFTAKLNGNTVSSFPLSVTDKGTYTLVLTGTGDYVGTKTITFSVLGNEDAMLSEDEAFDVNAEGRYYVNMRAVGPSTLTLPDATITTFKVYDDGGRQDFYSNNCNGTLTITAPEGYAIMLSGYVTVATDNQQLNAPRMNRASRRAAPTSNKELGNDYLTVYDGTTTSAPRLGKEKYGNMYIQPLYSTGRSMTLNFQSDDNNSMEGLELTVKLVSTTTEYDIVIPNDIQNGTITASVGGKPATKAKLNDKVTLTSTPADGYRLGRCNVYDQTNQCPVTVADDNTFLMPAGDIDIKASFIPAVSVTYIDEKGVSKTVLATPIESSEFDIQIYHPGFYTVSGTKTIDRSIEINCKDEEKVSLILQDDATLNCNRISGYESNFTIYGQSKGNGKINASGITALNYKQYGGNVNLSVSESYSIALSVKKEALIAGGSLTANAEGWESRGIYADNLTISGGQVTATGKDGEDQTTALGCYNSLVLGCSSSTDFIKVNGSINVYESYAPVTLSIATGQTLTDGTNTYTGVLDNQQLQAMNGKTLTPVVANITLANDDSNADAEEKNAAIITAKKGALANVTLQGRTLTKDGNWNTLCLPFSMTAKQIAASDLAGATIKELDNSKTGTSLDNGALTLKFKTVTAIEAGKPYIVKWTTTGSNISNPVFNDVIISSTAAAEVESDDKNVKFVGQYSPFDITDANKNEILYVASGNKIGYSAKARTLKSCRAHFWVKPKDTNAPAVNSINIDFGDGEVVTGITTTNYTNSTNSDEWYTLDGRKLNTIPNAKGVYINNGKKVVVK